MLSPIVLAAQAARWVTAGTEQIGPCPDPVCLTWTRVFKVDFVIELKELEIWSTICTAPQSEGNGLSVRQRRCSCRRGAGRLGQKPAATVRACARRPQKEEGTDSQRGGSKQNGRILLEDFCSQRMVLHVPSAVK